ncbi:nuclear transport factor 2 family protein [Gordonia sp. PP30]|uniref:nuclear transport factor 2 family protein n=1 Tax=unclassified Gordonia (in: high G+C Gram-positive bacteria) TaxID=2657482 RepID=UPI001FFFC3D4|nr:nuclear transport factor 2 family protein [Gordonia sp. PP30]UQE75036.1 nuclear transport factor 2 family protein [Gordonia sp. PP30]
MSADKRAVVDAYVELLSNGTAEQLADLYADGATVEDPIGAPIRRTRQELIEFYLIITGLDSREATLKWAKIAGDTAVFEFTLVTGTAGMSFEITPVDIMVFDDAGKIVSMRAVWEQSDLKQL